MHIRSAQLQDLTQVLQLFHRFFADTRCVEDDNLPIDPAVINQTLIGLIVSPHGNIVVAEEGHELVAALAIQASPQFFGRELVATELFWFTTHEWRGRGIATLTLAEAERWAKSIGARCVLMGLHSSSPAHARVMYERAGYRESQTAFIKRLT